MNLALSSKKDRVMALDWHLKLEISFCSLSLAFFLPIFFKLVRELILGRSILRLQIDKFCQIITDLWPLIVQICVLLIIFEHRMDFDKILYCQIYQ